MAWLSGRDLTSNAGDLVELARGIWLRRYDGTRPGCVVWVVVYIDSVALGINIMGVRSIHVISARGWRVITVPTTQNGVIRAISVLIYSYPGIHFAGHELVDGTACQQCVPGGGEINVSHLGWFQPSVSRAKYGL